MQLLFSKLSLHSPIAEDDDDSDSLPKSLLHSPTARQCPLTRPDVVLSGEPCLHSPFAEDDVMDLLPSRSSHNPPPATACSLNHPRMDFINVLVPYDYEPLRPIHPGSTAQPEYLVERTESYREKGPSPGPSHLRSSEGASRVPRIPNDGLRSLPNSINRLRVWGWRT
ncbi:hypothetical protein HYDPIDRAFT_119066 [Hydnomerulius pinastri MD-312]|uniref:Uncharacterized protein n=1 Tax=Hydnomerulius pinastri MD-312 TaxID=994086 RepID=A0A0C9W7P6_9AGAM|nr:hypothetical protein HYDPIDRAFT_119066 [Hydnomerulius pinastri MD-312]